MHIKILCTGENIMNHIDCGIKHYFGYKIEINHKRVLFRIYFSECEWKGFQMYEL